jgi:hypothetical protein
VEDIPGVDHFGTKCKEPRCAAVAAGVEPAEALADGSLGRSCVVDSLTDGVKGAKSECHILTLASAVR